MILGMLLSQAAQAAVTGVSSEALPEGGERVSFAADEAVEIRKAFLLAKPDRVVIDIARQPVGKLSLSGGKTLVKAIRAGQFDATTSRIVLDLKAPVKLLDSTSGAPFSVEILSTRPHKSGEVTRLDDKPLVVIDAGHGGGDPGALGVAGVREKDVTLHYAKYLREALLRTGRYRVLMTREDDRFVTLPERVNIARKAKGDLFVSLHADSNPKAEARGLSVYTLSETASDAEAAALAERENKADILPGIDLGVTDAAVENILIDLTQRETMNKSAEFADAIMASMSSKVNKLERPHRFAGFRVLKAPDIPSLLIELGFLSNEADERRLMTAEHREHVVAAIVKGIDRFMDAK